MVEGRRVMEEKEEEGEDVMEEEGREGLVEGGGEEVEVEEEVFFCLRAVVDFCCECVGERCVTSS